VESANTDPQEEWNIVQYADRVSLVVVPAKTQMEIESATEWHLMTLGSVRIDAVWLEEQIEQYVRGLPDQSNCGGAHPPYITEIKRGHTNWGASGASITALLYIGGAVATGVLGNAAYDLLKGMGGRVRDRLHWKDSVIPYSEDQAVDAAKQFIYNRYSVPPDLLQVRRVKSDLVNVTTEIEFFDHHEILYSCKIYMPSGGGVAVGEIARTSTDGTPIVIRRLGDG
jgi:hypothetical protein